MSKMYLNTVYICAVLAGFGMRSKLAKMQNTVTMSPVHVCNTALTPKRWADLSSSSARGKRKGVFNLL